MSTNSAEYMREYMSKRRTQIRSEMIDRLGGQCGRCEVTEDLEFDHVDRSSKVFDIASGLDKPRLVLEAEVDKCQLLCKRHHVEKTSGEEHPNRARGERSPLAKLKESDVREIRRSDLSNRRLGDQYGVGARTIYNIKTRRSWTHVE